MNRQHPPNGIEWCRIRKPDGTFTRGYTWNVITGCQHGCKWTMTDGSVAQCYAKSVAEGVASAAYPEGFEYHTFHPERLEEPFLVKEPAGIFGDSMADTFGHWVKDEEISQVLDVCRHAHWHMFLFLTKNAPRLEAFNFSANVWVGASSPPDEMFGKTLQREQQKHMLHRSLKALRSTNAHIRWMSFEPLSWDCAGIVAQYPGVLQWAVIGAASSGRTYYPPAEADFMHLLNVLDKQKIPVFFKGNLCSLPIAAANWREDFPGAVRPHPVVAHDEPVQMPLF